MGRSPIVKSPIVKSPYRQPAEDVEAKQDAIEVASFADKLRRQKKRGLGLAALAGVASMFVMVATVYVLVAIRSPVTSHHNCRSVYTITVHGNDAIRTEQRVCPNDNDPFASTTTIE